MNTRTYEGTIHQQTTYKGRSPF